MVTRKDQIQAVDDVTASLGFSFCCRVGILGTVFEPLQKPFPPTLPEFQMAAEIVGDASPGLVSIHNVTLAGWPDDGCRSAPFGANPSSADLNPALLVRPAAIIIASSPAESCFIHKNSRAVVSSSAAIQMLGALALC